MNTHKVQVSDLTETEHEGLIEELDQIRSKDADKDGKRKIVPKDEVKKNIGRSPDHAHTFIMRMFFELHKPKTMFMPAPTTGLVKPFPGMAA